MQRKIIRANGVETTLPGKKTMHMLGVIIGASGIDTFLLADRIHVMLVDDQGHYKNLPVNQKATELYLKKCRPGTTHVIRGDVVIVPDQDFA